jgi:hypothetical protein
MSRRVFAKEEFEAVGGYSGLWVPAVQPSNKVFMIHKFGAYAGRTLLILRDGRLLEFPGGLYNYDPTRSRLFLREETDVDPVTTVLDLNAAGTIFCASTSLENLCDLGGKRMHLPRDFICLPELAQKTKPHNLEDKPKIRN